MVRVLKFCHRRVGIYIIKFKRISLPRRRSFTSQETGRRYRLTSVFFFMSGYCVHGFTRETVFEIEGRLEIIYIKPADNIYR